MGCAGAVARGGQDGADQRRRPGRADQFAPSRCDLRGVRSPFIAGGRYGSKMDFVDGVVGVAELVPSRLVRLCPPGQVGGPGPDRDVAMAGESGWPLPPLPAVPAGFTDERGRRQGASSMLTATWAMGAAPDQATPRIVMSPGAAVAPGAAPRRPSMSCSPRPGPPARPPIARRGPPRPGRWRSADRHPRRRPAPRRRPDPRLHRAAPQQPGMALRPRVRVEAPRLHPPGLAHHPRL